MSSADAKDLLSPEELSALLTELKSAGDDDGPFAESAAARLAPLARVLNEFAEDQSRSLSTLHQRSIELQLLDFDELSMKEFGALLLPVDRVLELKLQPGDHTLYLLLGRSFVYGWLALAFGAKPESPMLPVPNRDYTRIEERFLRRAASDLMQQLQFTWSLRSPVEIEAVDLVEVQSLPVDPRKWAMASFDITGLGDICRCRLLLPQELYVQETQDEEKDSERQDVSRALQGAVLEMRVRVGAEAGFSDVPLRQVADLKVGDVLPLEPSDARGLVVCIEETPKYVGERGSLGGRLAVQLIESL